jgi:Spy/CpxP family protein refolding chaperone
MKTRLLGSALLIGTFVAGSLAGAAAMSALSAESRHSGEHARPGRPPMRGNPRRLLLDDAFAKEIALTDAQRAQIKQILDRRDVEMKKVWGEFEPRLKDFGKQVHDEIAKVLTPEQQAKLDAALEKRRGERKKHHECRADSTEAKQEKAP